MSENPSPLTRSGGQTPELEAVVAQLRHAYQQLIAHDERWSRRGMQQFADGLIAPQIRKLERILAAVCRETPQWRPIASAPKDGDTVQLCDGECVTVGGWIDAAAQGVDECDAYLVTEGWWRLDGRDEQPTLWAPLLPAPPAGGE